MTYSDLTIKINHKFIKEDGNKFNIYMDTTIPLSKGIVGVFGGSGHGKSTVLKICSGVLECKDSRVVWEGDKSELVIPDDAENNPSVYQDQSVTLFEHLTVEQNLKLVINHSLWAQKMRSEISLEKVIDWTGIGLMLNQRASCLSGGEKQRVGLARSLISGKPIIILDEPFSALDWANRIQMLTLIKRVQHESNIRFVIVSHSLRELAICCAHLIHLVNGQIKNQGSCYDMVQQLTLASNEPVFSRLEAKFEQSLTKYHLGKWLLKGEGQFIYTKDQTIPSIDVNPNSIQVVNVEADKVSIARSKVAESSILNQLEGSVIDIESYQHLMLVTIDIDGQELRSLISKLSFEQLELDKGQQVFAQFKAV
jgi:molybdate transport system ATP-binding protein